MNTGWYDRINEAVEKLSHTENDWTEEIERIELRRLESEVQLRDHIQTIDHLLEVLHSERKRADSRLSRLKKSDRYVCKLHASIAASNL